MSTTSLQRNGATDGPFELQQAGSKIIQVNSFRPICQNGTFVARHSVVILRFLVMFITLN